MILGLIQYDKLLCSYHGSKNRRVSFLNWTLHVCGSLRQSNRLAHSYCPASQQISQYLKQYLLKYSELWESFWTNEGKGLNQISWWPRAYNSQRTLRFPSCAQMQHMLIMRLAIYLDTPCHGKQKAGTTDTLTTWSLKALVYTQLALVHRQGVWAASGWAPGKKPH